MLAELRISTKERKGKFCCVVVSVLMLGFDAIQVLWRACSMFCTVLEGIGTLLEGDYKKLRKDYAGDPELS
jgi:hypothetical protein